MLSGELYAWKYSNKQARKLRDYLNEHNIPYSVEEHNKVEVTLRENYKRVYRGLTPYFCQYTLTTRYYERYENVPNGTFTEYRQRHYLGETITWWYHKDIGLEHIECQSD